MVRTANRDKAVQRRVTNEDYAKEFRDKTKSAIEAGIRELKEKQARDPQRYMIDQYKSQLRSKLSYSSAAVSDDEGSLKED